MGEVAQREGSFTGEGTTGGLRLQTRGSGVRRVREKSEMVRQQSWREDPAQRSSFLNEEVALRGSLGLWRRALCEVT